MGDEIRVGVIGCGEIAQLMHLPFLSELPEFRLAGLCDLSPATLEALGDRYGVRRRVTDYRHLLDDATVDAVAVCTYDHAPVVREALSAGKHVFVEKPLGFTPEEVADLPALARERSLVALVGYMKLFDAGFERGVAAINELAELRSLHVHDFAGRFDRYGDLYSTQRAADVPAEVIAAGNRAIAERVGDSLGPARPLADHYMTLLMLGSHDLAVMRGAFGRPLRVAYARVLADTGVHALLDYDNGVPCTFEVAFGYQFEWWDEWIAAYGLDTEVRIEFPNPYVRYAPTVVRCREPAGTSPSERVIPVSNDSPFRREWQHFADCVLNGVDVRSPLSDAASDLELARAIVAAIAVHAGEAR